MRPLMRTSSSSSQKNLPGSNRRPCASLAALARRMKSSRPTSKGQENGEPHATVAAARHGPQRKSMDTPALHRLKDCSYAHSDGYLEMDKPRLVRLGAVRIRAGMLTAALLGAIRHGDHDERANFVLADDSLAGEP